MAEEEKWADFNPLISGSNVVPGTTPVPERGWTGALMDTGIDVAKATVGVGKQIAGIGEAVDSAIDPRSADAAQARQGIDQFSAVNTILEGYKTPRGQELTREPEGFTTSPGKYIASTAAGMAPYIPLAIATGGWGGVPAFGALGFGQVRTDLRERLMDAPVEEMRKNPQYVDLVDQGFTDAQARDEIYIRQTDPRKLQTYADALPNVIGQAATGGAGGTVLRGLTKTALTHGTIRKETASIVQSIMDKANTNWATRRLTGAGIGAGAGAIAGGGQELSRQWSEQTAGIQTTPTDWSKVGDASGEMAALFGTLGTVGYRGPGKPKPEAKAAVPSVGVHIEAAASSMAADPGAGRMIGLPSERGEGIPKDPEVEYGAPHTPGAPARGGVPMSEFDYDPAGVARREAADRAQTAAEYREMGGARGATMASPVRPPPVEPGRPMEEGDLLGRGEYGAPEMYPGPAARRTRGMQEAAPADVAPVRPMVESYPGVEPSGSRAPFVPPRGSRTFTGEPPIHAPPGPALGPERPVQPTMRQPRGGPEFPEVGVPGLPGAGEFPHEGAGAPSWRGATAQRTIAEHLAKASTDTRGQIAAMLEAGARSVSELPAAVQRTLGKVANVVDRALEYDRAGTIAAVRGDVVEKPGGRQRLDATEKAAVEHLRDTAEPGVPDTVWAPHIGKLAGTRVLPFLKGSMKAAINALPEEARKAVTSAINKNPREVADMLAGREHKPPPREYVRKSELPKAKREAAAERKVDEETRAREATEEQLKAGPGKVEFEDAGERKTEVEHDLREDEYPGLLARPDYETSGREPHRAAKATEEDLGLKGGKYEREIKHRLAQRRGEKLGLKPGALEAAAAKASTTAPIKRGRESLSEQLQRVLGMAEAKREARRKELAEKTRPYSAALGQRAERPMYHVTERIKLSDLSEAQRKRRAQMRAEEKADLGDVYTQRMEQVFDEAIAAQKDAETQLAVQKGLDEFKEWEIAAGRGRGGALPDFWPNVDRLEADTVNAIRIEQEELNRSADRDRKSVRAKSEFRIRNLIAKDVLKKFKVTVEHLNKILTGVALDADGKYITKAGEARAGRWKAGTDEPLREKEQAEYFAKIERYESAMENWENDGGETSGRPRPSFPKAPKGQALNPLFAPFLNLPTVELKQIAFAFVREARERIAQANQWFADASTNQREQWGRHWIVSKEVGWDRRGDTGEFYNQLVDDKRFISAVAKYSGTAKKVSKKTDAGNRKMLQAIVLNHWISQQVARTGDVHKMKAAYQERVAVLREEMMEKYNLLSTETFAGNAKMQEALEAERKKIQEIFDDDAATLASPSGMETFTSITEPKADILQRLDEATKVARGELYTRDPTDPDIKKRLRTLLADDAIPDTALRVSADYVSRDIQEQYERRDVEHQRKHGPAIRATALDKEMVRLHGEGWRTLDPDTRAQLEGVRLMRKEYGAKAERQPGGGTVEPGRKMLPADIVQGLEEQTAFVTDGKPLSPEGRAYRVNQLMERADQILDEIEAHPWKADDPKLNDELRLLENEVRQHYEDAVPGARANEYGLGRVLQNGADLSDAANLPSGAYVRRVSDFLKEGTRGIRSGLDKVGGRLRNHMLDVAQRAVGDMEVVALTSEQMDMAAREKNLPGDTPSFYDPNTHRVFISQRVLHSADRDRILGHELAHPLTLRAAEMFPGIRRNLEKIHQELRDAYYKPSHPAHGAVHQALDGQTQALNNIHEFIGELYNDGGRVAQALHAISTPADLRKATHTNALWHLFDNVRETIKNGLNRLFFQQSKNRLLNDATMNSLHLFEQLERAGMYTPPHGKYDALPYTADEGVHNAGLGKLARYTKEDMAKWKKEEARIASMTQRMKGDEFWDWAKARAKDDPFLNKSLDLIMPLIRNDLNAHVYDPKIWPELEHTAGGDILGNYSEITHRLNVPADASASTIVHEAWHAATSRALEKNKPFKVAARYIMSEIQSHPKFKEYMAGLDPTMEAFHRRRYFLRDPHEFIAEFYSKPELRAFMDTIPVSKALADKLQIGAHHGDSRPSLFRAMLGMIAKFLRGDLTKAGEANVGRLTEKLVADVLKYQKEEVGPYKRTNFLGEDIPSQPTHYRNMASVYSTPPDMDGVVSKAGEVWRDTTFRLQRMGLTGAFLKTHTFVDLRRRAEEGMQAVVRGVEDVWSKIETTSRAIFRDSGAEDIAFKIADEMRMPPKVFQKLQDYVSQENHWKVSGEDDLYVGKNAWVSRDSPWHQHYRDRHAELRSRYNELTDSQKELRRRMLDYYDGTHGKILRGNLTKIISMRDMVPGNDAPTIEALVKHITKEDLTDADKRLLEKVPGYESEIDLTDKSPAHVAFRQNVRDLRSNPLFKKVEGVWYPSKRRGNYVVEGRYDLAPVAERYGGRQVDDKGNIFEFDDDATAQKFYRDIVDSDAYGGIHHAGTTEVVYKADASGRPVLDAEGKPVYETEYSERTTRTGEEGTPGFREVKTGVDRRVSAKAAVAEGGEGTVTRHRVEFNNLLLEFYENPRHAYERHAELQGDPNLKLTGVEPKRQTAGTYLDPKKASRVYETLMNSLERSKAWENMDATTRKMATRDLEEAAVQHIMSVSARSTRIPKRYALGADKSMLQDFNDYSRNSSMTLAEQEHRPALSSSLKTMDDYVGDNRMWTAGSGDLSGAELRRKLQHEVHERLFTRPNELTHGFWTKALARVLQISYMDKLLSPGFVVLNASEPWVIGAPLLTGHHGFKAYAEIGRAYAAIGFLGVWGKGGVNAWKAGAEGVRAKFEDNHTLLTERIKGETDAADLKSMLDYGAERGYFDRDAGMELAQRVDPTATMAGRGLDYVDNISRQVNTQIENVNRSVMAIASYRLGRQKGWTHEKAMQHAFDMVHDTSGNYGHWNTPGIFNDPRLKFALQFRRYGARITANYIRMFAQSFGNAPPEVKAVARKQLAVTLGSQMILAGQLGLPTEPIKLALLLTSPITGFGPDEAEVWAREAMANATGDPQLAEGIMRGFPRAYLDLGIGTRIGHDSVWSHGTLGKKPDNWYSAAGHYLVGAPGGMLVDWAMAGGKVADAAINAARGRTTQAGTDAADAFQLAFPAKLVSDTLGAARTYMGGPKTTTTAGQPVGYQPTFGQAVMEATGIRTGTQQEAGDKRFALSQAKAQYATEKNKAFQMYVRASNPAEQRAIEEQAIRRSKENWPKEMQLTHNDFYKAKRRFELNQSADPSDVGVHISKRERGLRERFDFFNV